MPNGPSTHTDLSSTAGASELPPVPSETPPDPRPAAHSVPPPPPLRLPPTAFAPDAPLGDGAAWSCSVSPQAEPQITIAANRAVGAMAESDARTTGIRLAPCMHFGQRVALPAVLKPPQRQLRAGAPEWLRWGSAAAPRSDLAQANRALICTDCNLTVGDQPLDPSPADLPTALPRDGPEAV